MNRQLRTLAASLLLMFIVGCGQSGALYIPGNPSTVQPPSAAPADDAKDEEDSDEPDETDESGNH
ncbi:MAG: lipoprotein [Proteobacteria bacterium]|nr:lipoprotein [Pseudomonadota bacterium]